MFSSSQDELFSYKVKFRKGGMECLTIHHFHAKFKSIVHMNTIISQEEISAFGYFEGRQHWLAIATQDGLTHWS